MPTQILLTETKDHTLTITLNRPDVRNAFNEEMIAELVRVCSTEAASDDVRVVFIRGAGKVFSAGGDLQWLKKSAEQGREEIREEALKFGRMLAVINTLGKPVVGLVHGAALGGGMGLVSVCDYVVASKEALFGFPEAKVGLIPAVIAPYVISKIGESHTRALFLTAGTFSAQRACEIGLIHQVAESPEDLQKCAESIKQDILALSPQALKTAKQFISDLRTKPDAEKPAFSAQTLADLRATKEAQEGIQAFLEKRKPKW